MEHEGPEYIKVPIFFSKIHEFCLPRAPGRAGRPSVGAASASGLIPCGFFSFTDMASYSRKKEETRPQEKAPRLPGCDDPVTEEEPEGDRGL
jgi:hypothetical protein